MIDEGPSPEDLDRFGDDGDQEGYCPDCGERIWDAAEACPACGAWVGGRILARPPTETAMNRRIMVGISIIVLIAFILVFAL